MIYHNLIKKFRDINTKRKFDDNQTTLQIQL